MQAIVVCMHVQTPAGCGISAALTIKSPWLAGWLWILSRDVGLGVVCAFWPRPAGGGRHKSVAWLLV